MDTWTEGWRCPKCGGSGEPRWSGATLKRTGGPTVSIGELFAHCTRCGYEEEVAPLDATGADKGLRDAAREMVRTINAMPIVTFDSSVLPLAEYHLQGETKVDVNPRQLMGWLDRLDRSAKTLEGKL
jgi:hypothetical protein